MIKKVMRAMLPKRVLNKVQKIKTEILALCAFLNHRKIFHKKHGEKKLNIVFLVLVPQSWNSLKTVYEAAKRNENVNPYVVVVPHPIIRSDGSYIESFDFFSKECPGAINAKKGKGLFDIKKLHPDIVFRQSPYDESWPKEYSYARIAQYAKICYVPYNYNFSPKKHLEIEYGHRALRNTYAIFSESEINKQFCHEIKKEVKWYQYLQIYYLGFPRFDLLRRVCSEEKRGNIVFTWIPRWSTDGNTNDATSFFEYQSKLIYYFGNHRELSLIIRPHPMMFDNFIKIGRMTKEEVLSFVNRIAEEPNIQLDDNLDYLDTFRITDVLIADMSSLNFEFFLLGKPIIYCGDPKEFNHETKDMMSLCYKVAGWKELEKYLNDLSTGIDPNERQRKQACLKFMENIPENIGERIINKCLEIA